MMAEELDSEERWIGAEGLAETYRTLGHQDPQVCAGGGWAVDLDGGVTRSDGSGRSPHPPGLPPRGLGRAYALGGR